MSDQDALLAHVLEYPDTDLPRLVYADFLEESGDGARAEFIRVQCALSRNDFESDSEKSAFELRERYLREKYLTKWLAPLKVKGEALHSPRSHGLFQRGFVECVWMPARWFVTKADRLFARCPVKELRVTLTSVEDFQDLVNSPHLPRLKTLEVADSNLGRGAIPILEQAATDGKLNALCWLKLPMICFEDDQISNLYHVIPHALIMPIGQGRMRTRLEQAQMRARRTRRDETS